MSCQRKKKIIRTLTDDEFTFILVRYYYFVQRLDYGKQYHFMFCILKMQFGKVHASICNYSALLDIEMAQNR